MKSIAVRCEFNDFNISIWDQFVFGLGEWNALWALLEEDAGTLSLDNMLKKLLV